MRSLKHTHGKLITARKNINKVGFFRLSDVNKLKKVDFLILKLNETALNRVEKKISTDQVSIHIVAFPRKIDLH